MGATAIAIGPTVADYAADAVRAGGGIPVAMGEPADAVVWLSPEEFGGLTDTLEHQPEISWVQLPFAGIEKAVEAGVVDPGRRWTCAKGSYAEPVAEHALMLALAGLRLLPDRLAARSWGAPAGESLFGAPVTVVGGGGITEVLLRLLAPFGVEATVVRRRDEPLPGAARTVTTAQLADTLPGAMVVFLALALTPETTGIIGDKELDLMDERAWLVNVARGRHVDTDALVAALHEGRIGGAALDVTDPEPLPDGHPLWSAPNRIITPHTADTPEMVMPLLADRIRVNVARFIAGLDLEGAVDVAAGY